MLTKILIKILSIKPIKKLVFKFFSYRFIAGEEMEDALREAENLNKKNIAAIINYLGEETKTSKEICKNINIYSCLIKEIARKNLNARISVKPSQLGLKVNEDLYLKNLLLLGILCSQHNIHMEIDMEEFDSIEKTVKNSIQLKKDLPNLHLRQCLQITAKRSAEDIKNLINTDIRIRLCKGAYKIPNSAALLPRDYVSFRIIVYANCVFSPFIEVATHDEKILGNLKKGIGVQLLKGFLEKKREEIAKKNPAAAYIPFGENWMPYGIRRLFYLIKNGNKIFE